MPLFFFHITHDHPRVDDELGTDLPDRKAVWDQATTACGEMIREIDGHLAIGTDWQMDVSDETKHHFTIRIGAYEEPITS